MPVILVLGWAIGSLYVWLLPPERYHLTIRTNSNVVKIPVSKDEYPHLRDLSDAGFLYCDGRSILTNVSSEIDRQTYKSTILRQEILAGSTIKDKLVWIALLAFIGYVANFMYKRLTDPPFPYDY